MDTKNPQHKSELNSDAGQRDESPSVSFDLKQYRLPQTYSAAASAKKVLATVPVRKPAKQSFIRVRPEPEYRFQAAVLEFKEEMRSDTYLVAPHLIGTLEAELVAKELFTAIDRQGAVFLWAIRLPGADGRLDDWNRSAREAAEIAMGSWVRVVANSSLNAYEVFKAVGEVPEPEWPPQSFEELMGLGFKGRVITTLDHPIVRKLQGAL